MKSKIWWILGDQCYHWFQFPKNTDFVFWESKYFTNRIPYHKQKLLLLFSSMRIFADTLKEQKYKVDYFDINTPESKFKLEEWLIYLYKNGVRELNLFKLNNKEDDIIELAKKINLDIIWNEESTFLTNKSISEKHFLNKSKFQFLPFYKDQRKSLNLLLENNKPLGGKWTFDSENRKPLPKNIVLPEYEINLSNKEILLSKRVLIDINTNIDNSIGEAKSLLYPIIPETFWIWFDKFLEERFHFFGTYEDAIDKDSHTVFHSVISMNLNNGIIHPQEIIEHILDYYKDNQDRITINQIEGFLRQIIGWREYIKNIYDVEKEILVNSNFFRFTRAIPSSFWDGSTGLLPIDNTINKVLKTGYAHHIERLMVLGNFMLLLELNPQEVNNWFNSMFVDAYEWVMLPNVIGMSQYADGGKMMTKPYISSSNYILKMSNYKKDGYWELIWDSLFWNFINNHYDTLKNQARMYFMTANWDKKSLEEKSLLLNRAKEFLDKLSSDN